MFFDSHCHLDEPRLARMLPEVLTTAREAGVGGFLVPGVHRSGWNRVALLSAAYPFVFPAFGIHPMHADLATPEALSELRHLVGSASAIGEIGLDYLLESPRREVQKEAFRRQLAVALDAGLPVLIHCRKGFGDLLEILEAEGGGGLQGVMHACSGSVEVVRECLRLGLHVSVAGSVTYANALRPLAVACEVPSDRLLLETDAPDLAPAPYRGQLNLPHYLPIIAARVAGIRGVPVAELARTTTDNACRLFRLDPRRF